MPRGFAASSAGVLGRLVGWVVFGGLALGRLVLGLVVLGLVALGLVVPGFAATPAGAVAPD